MLASASSVAPKDGAAKLRSWFPIKSKERFWGTFADGAPSANHLANKSVKKPPTEQVAGHSVTRAGLQESA